MRNKFFPDNLKDWVNIASNIILIICALFVVCFTALECFASVYDFYLGLGFPPLVLQ